jgi:hypothetical protein
MPSEYDGALNYKNIICDGDDDVVVAVAVEA